MSRIYLHIGAPKTGTTYLQAVLHANRERLAEAGVLYPGRDAASHYDAVLDLRGLAFGGYRDPRSHGAWDRLVKQVLSWRGESVVISHELLAGADEEALRRAVESFPGHEVHVVYTARDLARQVPAMWQESVKNGQGLAFPAYVKRLTRVKTKGRAAKIFWRQQHAGVVLERWSAHVRPTLIHLVTVPASGSSSDLLWERFASVVGLSGVEVDTRVEQQNTSLGFAQAELLRQVNRSLDGSLPWQAYGPTVKFWFAERVLTEQSGQRRAVLPARRLTWFRHRADEIVDALTAAGYDIVGDLDELAVRADATGPKGGGPPDVLVHQAAVDAIAAMLTARADEHEHSTRTRIARRAHAQAVMRRLPRRLRARFVDRPR